MNSMQDVDFIGGLLLGKMIEKIGEKRFIYVNVHFDKHLLKCCNKIGFNCSIETEELSFDTWWDEYKHKPAYACSVVIPKPKNVENNEQLMKYCGKIAEKIRFKLMDLPGFDPTINNIISDCPVHHQSSWKYHKISKPRE